jgi:hypothetical protein
MRNRQAEMSSLLLLSKISLLKVAGSIPNEVIVLNLPNRSGCTRPWGLLSPNRNECQKHTNYNVLGE